LAAAVGVRVSRMDAADFTACAPLRPNHGLIRPEVATEADPEHPFDGWVIVFTGALVTMTRQEAWEAGPRAVRFPSLA
jgi:BRCT domain type II-containing protein